MHTFIRRRLAAVAAVVGTALSPGVLMAQTPDDELAKLRQFLKLSDSSKLDVSVAPALPAATPVKLFIATGLDLGVRQNFVKWADEWNRKDGKKHGPVVLVNDIEAADVILARYAERDKATTGTDTNLGSGVVYDPGSQKVSVAPYAREYSYTEVPLVAYVVARSAPTVLEIVWRYTGMTSVEEHKNSGRQLWDDFKSLMKNRSKR